MTNAEKTTPAPHAGGRGYVLTDLPGKADVLLGSPEQFAGRIGPRARMEKWRPFGRRDSAALCWLDVRARDVEPDVAAERIRTIHRNVHGQGRDVDALEIECVRQRGHGRRRGEVHRWFGASLEWEVEWATANDLPEDRAEIDGQTFVRLVFDLDFPAGLAWHYQPALSQQEIDVGAQRPDNVVGSYAVYWHRAGRIIRPNGTERVNYETGKFCHLYRPQLIDAAGQRCWCSVSVDQTLDAAELTIAMPLAWLQSATYPVTLDPNFGWETIGGSTHTWTANYMGGGGMYSPATDGTIQSVTFHFLTNATTQVTLGIYNSDPTYDAGDLLVDSAGESYGTTAIGWKTQTMDSNPAVNAADEYVFGWNCDTTITYSYDLITGSALLLDAETYQHGALSDPFPTSRSKFAWRPAIYGTYTESATGRLPWHLITSGRAI